MDFVGLLLSAFCDSERLGTASAQLVCEAYSDGKAAAPPSGCRGAASPFMKATWGEQALGNQATPVFLSVLFLDTPGR